MINLLPPKEKKELLVENNLKVTVILGYLSVLFLVCLSLLFISINIFIKGGIETQKILFDQREKELETFKMQALQNDLVSFNETLASLKSFYRNEDDFVDILERISNTVPGEMNLSNLSVSPQSKGGIVCNLSGFSPDRDLLLELKDNLEKEGLFIDVYFPPANWVKPTDINFTASFKINDSE